MTTWSSWSSFHVVTQAYHTVHNHDVLVDINFPKSSNVTKHPVIIFWHSGALITGNRAFRPFMQDWVPKLAASQSAVIVSPDYRLLPEANGTDVLEDVEALWTWVQTHLASVVAGYYKHQDETHTVDFGRILATGPSAGGFCATHMALRHPEALTGLLIQYPMVDIDDKFWTKGNGGNGFPYRPAPPREEVDKYVSEISSGTVVSVGGLERIGSLVAGAAAWGLVRSWIGGGPEMSPMVKTKTVRRLPPKVYAISGTADDAIAVESVKEFVDVVQRFCPGSQVKGDYWEGLGHGFDTQLKDDATLENGVAWATENWRL